MCVTALNIRLASLKFLHQGFRASFSYVDRNFYSGIANSWSNFRLKIAQILFLLCVLVTNINAYHRMYVLLKENF